MQEPDDAFYRQATRIGIFSRVHEDYPLKHNAFFGIVL